MISTKKLLRLAKNCQTAAKVGGKNVSLSRTSSTKEEASVARKGHFAVYTTNGKRFEVPLSYLANGVLIQLLIIAEEEFGIPGDGPMVLPLDASSMENLMSMIRRGLAPAQEKALLTSFTRCSSSYFSDDKAHPCRQIICI
ncbi:hypothetical protein MLD38_036303 [Melastoma candidum]|uniref:Uncharacterized protein n=1 Tax=Melastoma candidum TaxID=119954 RepID=A0ACB9LJ54_9MYRT|nr:hypothetical protein MLD38_036303 [Melastoma candidum]